MPAREIPRAQWPYFLSDFAYRHFGWKAVVEGSLSANGNPVNGSCFLEEFITERAGDHERITIVLGSPFRRFHECIIHDPNQVCMGRRHALEITSGDGSSVVVRMTRHALRATASSRK